MRKLFSILSIALATLFAVGCQPNDKPGVDGNKDLTLTDVVANSNTIKATITPADKSAKYFAGIVLNSEVESLNDSAIITNYLQTFTMYNGEQIISANNLEIRLKSCCCQKLSVFIILNYKNYSHFYHLHQILC